MCIRDRFNVILHGDTHLRNILFKIDRQSRVTECKFVDFQMCRLGSPIIDIMDFFITGVEFKVFEEGCRSLLTYYVREFESTLNELNYINPSPFGLDELLDEINKLFFLHRFTYSVPFFWAGHMSPGPLNGENNIDTVLKSAKLISLFKEWTKFFLSSTSSLIS